MGLVANLISWRSALLLAAVMAGLSARANDPGGPVTETLLVITREQDTDALVDLFAPDIRTGFGPDDEGPDAARRLREEFSGSGQGWRVLARLLAFGCSAEQPGATAYPSIQCPAESELRGLDPYQVAVVPGCDRPVRNAPSNDAPELFRACRTAMPLRYDETVDPAAIKRGEGFLPIAVPGGRTGYISAADAFLPVGWRIRLEHRPHGWVIAWFGAGD